LRGARRHDPRSLLILAKAKEAAERRPAHAASDNATPSVARAIAGLIFIEPDRTQPFYPLP